MFSLFFYPSPTSDVVCSLRFFFSVLHLVQTKTYIFETKFEFLLFGYDEPRGPGRGEKYYIIVLIN